MKTYRLGNTITIRWTISLANGEPFTLNPETVELVAIAPHHSMIIDDFTVDSNVLTWIFKGSEQKYLGPYTLTLIQNRGKVDMVTVDICEAFALVPWSCMAGGNDDAAGVETESLEISSTVSATQVTLSPEVEAAIKTATDPKQDKEDPTLQTKDKTIPGAINENHKFTIGINYAIESNGIKSFIGTDFVKGFYEYGTGIVPGDYNVVTNPIKISVGDKINIASNGNVASMRIFDSEGIANAQTLKNERNLPENYEYISEYDGYLQVGGIDSTGQLINPENCKIIFSITKFDYTQIERNRKEIVGLKEQVSKNTQDISTLNKGIGDVTAFVDGFDSIKKNIILSPLGRLNTTIVNDCQDSSTYTISSGSEDTENKLWGTHSVHVTNGYVRFSKNLINMVENNLTIMVKINSLAEGPDNALIVRVGNTSNPSLLVTYQIMRDNVNTVYGQWQEFTIPYLAYSYISGGDSIDFTQVNDIIINAPGGDFNVQFIGTKPNSLKNGIVTFTFDDGWKTQIDGAKALAKRGLSGTIFAIKSAIEQNNPEFLTLDDIKDLSNTYGIDIECHGPSSFDDMEDDALIQELQGIQDLLVTNGISKGKYMAYPNGFHSPRVVQISKRFFKACRTIQDYTPIESYPAYDNFRIRAMSSIIDANVEKVKGYIDKAKECGGWLVLVFHKIETGDGSGMYCSLSALEQIIDYAKDSGINILNFKDVFESSNTLSIYK